MCVHVFMRNVEVFFVVVMLWFGLLARLQEVRIFCVRTRKAAGLYFFFCTKFGRRLAGAGYLFICFKFLHAAGKCFCKVEHKIANTFRIEYR